MSSIQPLRNLFENSLEAVKYLSSKNHKLQYYGPSKFHYELLQITDKINSIINQMPFADHFKTKRAILVAFESIAGEKECKIFWKSARFQNIYELSFKESERNDGLGITFYMHLIMAGINVVKLVSRKRKISEEITIHQTNLESLVDSRGVNFLIYAVKQRDPDLVQKLLKFSFNLDHIDESKCTAIDHAWCNYENAANDEKLKGKCDKILTELLAANSQFPSADVNFNSKRASPAVRNFLTARTKLNKYIHSNIYISLKREILKEPRLVHYYNHKNESIMAFALKMNNINAVNMLTSYEVKVGNHEKLEELLKNLNNKNKKVLRKQIIDCAIGYKDAHIAVLLSKCSISNHEQRTDDKWNYITKAFNTLNENRECKIILQLAALWDKLKIIFDFTQDSTLQIDPKSSKDSNGIIYDTGCVYIGAKGLLNELTKYKVIGCLIHELCHCAILLAYRNTFNPYPMESEDPSQQISSEKQQYNVIFNNIKERCSKKTGKFEEIILGAIEGYEPEHQPSELIVRPIQIIMNYQENQAMIDENRREFPELFTHFSQVVIPEMECAIKVMKELQKEDCKLKFSDLTEPMKAFILHTDIKLQDEDTSFYEMIGNDLEVATKIRSNLTTEDIKTMLENEYLYIGSKLNVDSDRYVMERKLIRHGKKLNEGESADTVGETLKEISANNKNPKVSILAEPPGAGKSIIFEELAVQLKDSNKSSWVLLIKCWDHQDILKKYKNKLENLKAVDILLEIVDTESKLEENIFRHLLSIGKVTLLFDGVDEVCPELKEVIFKLLEKLNETTQNQMWISTRPHLAKELEVKLSGTIFKFVPISWDETLEYISEILKSHPSAQDLNNIKLFLRTIEHRSNAIYKIDNASMLQTIAKVFGDTSNIYEIFEDAIKMEQKRVYGKIPFEDGQIDSKFKKDDVCTVFALKRILATEEFADDLQCLAILRNWSNAHKPKKTKGQESSNPCTIDIIQRNGLLTIDLDSQEYENSLKFVHIAYGEIILVQHIILHLFGEYAGIDDKQYEKIFNILRSIGQSIGNFEVVCKFLLGYIGTEKDEEDSMIHEQMREFIIKNIKNIHQDILDSRKYIDLLEMWCGIIDQDREILKMFWKPEGAEKFLMTILKNKTEEHQCFIKTFNIFVPQWWKVVKGIDMDENSDQECDESKFSRNLCKFLDIAKDDFELSEIKFIRENYANHESISREITPQVRAKCLEKFPESSQNAKINANLANTSIDVQKSLDMRE